MARKKVERTQDDVREYPSYSIEEVADYLGVPHSTMRSWVSGYKYRTKAGNRRAPAMIQPADPKRLLLSFFNLVEAQVLASTRERKVSVSRVRRAVEYMREKTGEARPLLNCIFATHGQDLFIESLHGQSLRNPINASKHGQLAFGKVLAKYLKRIERDAAGLPTIVYPLKVGQTSSKKVITIRPFVSAGKPTLRKSGVMAEVIWMRKREGENIASLARDFRVQPSEIKAAIQYFAA